MPSQTDIEKILKIIQRKVLKGTHLPVTIKQIQVGYLNSPYFKDLCLYLTQNRLSSSKSAICKVEVLAEIHNIRFIAIEAGHHSRKGNCIVSYTRNVCRQDNYTLSFKSVHWTSSVIKTYLTTADKFFIPDIMHYLYSYIKGCHICQLSMKGKSPTRHLKQE